MSSSTNDPAPQHPLRLSVLDLIPVRSNQTSADAVAATVELARVADELGFERFWVAEHHNMPAVASTNPAVLAGILAANTRRIRIGSGGVMLPNHSPLVVAEQFAILEAAFPGRIDLGIGRAPGSDPVITGLLRSSGTTSDVNAFEHNINDILALLDAEGAALQLPNGRAYSLSATPKAASVPTMWLLGSSDYSARLAARLGLPYVFAHHFSGEGTEGILDLYRSGFADSGEGARPTTFLTLNVSVAATAEEAFAAALPNLQQMARLRTGAPLGPLATVEEAAEAQLTAPQQQMVDAMLERWVIDEPVAAARRIRGLAERFGVDEVMVVPGLSARSTDAANSSPGRIESLRLLARELMPSEGHAA
ncbi:LLM class flavin-dependent oxidoreductase [Salinibacterium sp. SYSU T00001]|uniref:LLM class flavin-dependent oxidoreductase n=1 Tax=Homoserinimonas sedimenticola TaxID=2986805 RepID=UPI002235E3BF|nr:LLM class flavin-dependent oxidoreductase [Salinibacterium sedimenticola]MCW4384171.1 LLM class flavin-dependent oxidoreductase [Salinibacterium sedimenticola]